jgi:hypothetical protein
MKTKVTWSDAGSLGPGIERAGRITLEKSCPHRKALKKPSMIRVIRVHLRLTFDFFTVA